MNLRKIDIKQIHPIPAITFALTLLALMASYKMFYQWQVVDSSEQQLQQVSSQIALQQAKAITDVINEQRSRIDTFASRSALGNLFDSDSNTLKTTAAASVRSAFPEANEIRLFDKNKRDHFASSDATPIDLSFIEIDQLNKSFSGKTPPIELLRTEQTPKTGLLLYTAKIYRPTETSEVEQAPKEAPAGALMLLMPGKRLFDTFNSFDKSKGETEIINEVGRTSVVIFRQGKGIDGYAQQHKIDHSNWKLTFKPSERLRQQHTPSNKPILIAHIIAALILVPILTWLSLRLVPAEFKYNWSRRNNNEDTVSLQQVELAQDDEDILELENVDVPRTETRAQPSKSPPKTAPDHKVDPQIFRTYDIRGIAGKQISTSVAYLIGKSIASEVLDMGGTSVYVGRDGRLSSKDYAKFLIKGALDTGCDVIDIDLVPTPLLYFACCRDPKHNGIMVTASHNGPEWNGFKIVINGQTLLGKQIEAIQARIENDHFHNGKGHFSKATFTEEYIDYILNDVALAGQIKLVIDAANGATSTLAPKLFEALGCEVTPLFCEIDGNFPNHAPDPTRPENLQALINKVRETGADLGIALDGDGDRLVAVTPSGEIIWPDRMMMLFAKDIVTRNPGCDVVFDVKCSRMLSNVISNYGGRPIMWKSGHSNIKRKIHDTGALLGGEFSGHIFIKDRWFGFDDGMYAAARLLEIMTLREQDADELFADFEVPFNTPEIIVPVHENDKFALVEQLIQKGDFKNAEKNTLDGLRIEFSKGWCLIRPSNTSEALTLRFEGESEQVVEQMQTLMKRELGKVAEDIKLPF